MTEQDHKLRLRDEALAIVESSNNEIEFELDLSILDSHILSRITDSAWKLMGTAFEPMNSNMYADPKGLFLERFLKELCSTELFIEALIFHFEKIIKKGLDEGRCGADFSTDVEKAKELYKNGWLTDLQFIGILKDMHSYIDDSEVYPDFERYLTDNGYARY
jgi:hypothetical protein|tara:strand:- start:468 stop:953 length:486 start_codon:yes stop_codon:yes gene_type:complete